MITYFVQKFLKALWVVPLLLLFIASFCAPSIYDATDYRDSFKYLGIAWGMLQSGDYLVPAVNGILYTDKPPLFFWMIIGWWKIFGFNLAWLQGLTTLFLFSWVLLSQATYKALFPEDTSGKTLLPYILLGSIAILEHTHLLRVDLLLVTGVLFLNLGICQKLMASSTKNALFSDSYIIMGTLLGLFAKGPTVFIFTLLPYIIFSVINKTSWKVNIRVIGMTFIGVGLFFLCWALPAMLAAGHSFSQQILYGQLSGRVHYDGPGYSFYPRYLVLMLMPWLVNIVYFQKFLSTIKQFCNGKSLFLVLSIVCSFIVLMLFGEKMARYLLPSIPYYMIIFTRYFSVYAEDDKVKSINRKFFQGLFILLTIMSIAVWLSPKLQYFFFFRGEAHDSQLSFVFIFVLMLVNGIIAAYTLCSKQNFLQFLKCVSLGVAFVYIIISTCLNLLTKDFIHMDLAMQYLQKHQQQGIAFYPDDTSIGLYNYAARMRVIPVLETRTQLFAWLIHHPYGTVIMQSYECTTPLHSVLASYRRKLSHEIPFQFCRLAFVKENT